MSKFRKKPVVIEAVRVEKPWRDVHLFCQPHGKPIYEADGRTVSFFIIKALEAELEAARAAIRWLTVPLHDDEGYEFGIGGDELRMSPDNRHLPAVRAAHEGKGEGK